jgi:hypothetical protein
VRRPEQSLHISAVHFLRWALPEPVFFLHPSNGGKRTAAEAALFKAMGQLAGASDLIFFMPDGTARFLEFKADKGRATEAQEAFQARVEAIGCEYRICRSLDELEGVVSAWLWPFGLKLKARAA